jgi:hypothetical protein
MQTSKRRSHDFDRIDIEHRITSNEHQVETLSDQMEDHDRRISLNEKAILGLASAVYILAQDRFPAIAALLRGVIP